MRILALSDQIHPFIYQERFPSNLPPFDLVLIAGDLPGSYIEFVATKVRVPVVYVHGNHKEEYVQDYLGHLTPPGGAIPAHGRIVRVAGLRIAGWGGCPRYNRREMGQYAEAEAQGRFLSWLPLLMPHRLAQGHGVDILLSHAPPPGPHAGPDFAHRGSSALGLFHRLYRPRLHVHGHVHLYEAQPQREYLSPEGVRVVNAFAYTLIEL
ncbi:Calcineurin-like phosphoesterase [Meiothermus luteus]|uniref:Calcineurin-like phosphoesterase n=1 Tax=Meiothermus luteus TaxID=2026184 RepID=A0A399EL55_9DEIN|nr:metallophosphoesterase [Meiothermus luteus]RIH84193.1 Calcineurin-like phosphoesterase [Meiothermus luteus]